MLLFLDIGEATLVAEKSFLVGYSKSLGFPLSAAKAAAPWESLRLQSRE